MRKQLALLSQWRPWGVLKFQPETHPFSILLNLETRAVKEVYFFYLIYHFNEVAYNSQVSYFSS